MSQVFHIVLSDVDIIDQDRAEFGVIETHHKVDEGRFAGARLTNDRNNFIGVNSEVEALEDPLAFALRVAEPNVFEGDLAVEGR